MQSIQTTLPGLTILEPAIYTDERMRVLYVPVGFAHGFCVLSEIADVLYKQTETAYYDPAVERGVAWDDPEIGPNDRCPPMS